MRSTILAALALSVLCSPAVYASESVAVSLGFNVLKLGKTSSKSEPVAGESSTDGFRYAEVLGFSAEDGQPTFFEFGLTYDQNVLYFIPLGSIGERELWLGRAVTEELEAGVVFAGYAKNYDPSVAVLGNTSKLKSSNVFTLGAYATYSFDALGHGWELTTVPYYTSQSVKFEESASDESSSGSGLSSELLMVREVYPNLNFAAGLSFDWEKTTRKIGSQKVSTTTDTDLGFHVGRVRYSF